MAFSYQAHLIAGAWTTIFQSNKSNCLNYSPVNALHIRIFASLSCCVLRVFCVTPFSNIADEYAQILEISKWAVHAYRCPHILSIQVASSFLAQEGDSSPKLSLPQNTWDMIVEQFISPPKGNATINVHHVTRTSVSPTFYTQTPSYCYIWFPYLYERVLQYQPLTYCEWTTTFGDYITFSQENAFLSLLSWSLSHPAFSSKLDLSRFGFNYRHPLIMVYPLDYSTFSAP